MHRSRSPSGGRSDWWSGGGVDRSTSALEQLERLDMPMAHAPAARHVLQQKLGSSGVDAAAGAPAVPLMMLAEIVHAAEVGSSSCGLTTMPQSRVPTRRILSSSPTRRQQARA